MILPDILINTFDERIQKALQMSSVGTSVSNDIFSGLLLEHKDIKNRTQVVLRRIYEIKGYTVFMEVISNLKKFSGKEKDDVIIAKGEIAEIVCEIMMEYFILERGLKDWRIYKGLILGSKKDSNFSTELDMVLATPTCISVIEVKSYNGKKTLEEECTLVVRELRKNVFSQNVLHIKSFWENFKDSACSTQGAVKSVLFSFAYGTLADKRTPTNKAMMPAYSEDNFISYLVALEQLNRQPIWNINKLDSLVKTQKETARTFEAHVNYLKRKHNK